MREKLPEGFQRSELILEKGAIDMIVDRRELRDEEVIAAADEHGLAMAAGIVTQFAAKEDGDRSQQQRKAQAVRHNRANRIAAFG